MEPVLVTAEQDQDQEPQHRGEDGEPQSPRPDRQAGGRGQPDRAGRRQALCRDAARRGRCFWMILASARKASLTSPALGNTDATSGSRTTTTLPARYRDAYLFARPPLKSYSGSISSFATRPLALGLTLSLLIASSLPSCRLPGTDKTNRLVVFGKHHGQDSSPLGKSEQHVALFVTHAPNDLALSRCRPPTPA